MISHRRVICNTVVVVRRLIFSRFIEGVHWSKSKIKDYFGLSDTLSKATKVSRTGLGLSGALLILAGLWLLAVEPGIVAGLIFSTGLIGFGLFNLILALTRGL